MERIMILGAGHAQLPLVRTAQSMGYKVVVATIPGPYPCIDIADFVSYTDVTDKEAVARAAAEYSVCAIASCCLEICLPTQAFACEMLGLPGLSPEAAEISVNKLAMHRALDKDGIRSPRYHVLRDPDELEEAIADLGFPLVVKAADLWSSRGVFVVHSAMEARKAFEESLDMSNESYVLAEEFIAGRSCCAEAFVQNGRILFVLPDGNLTFSSAGRPDIPIGHYVPFDCSPELFSRIREEVEKTIRSCKLDNCAVNMDIVLREGEPYIIELTARAGATALSELISQYFGIDYYRMLLLAALGQDAKPYFSAHPVPRPTAAAMLVSDVSGVVRSIRLPSALPDGVQELTLLVQPGDRVRRFENAGDRIGQILVTGGSTADCLARIEDISKKISIEVDE